MNAITTPKPEAGGSAARWILALALLALGAKLILAHRTYGTNDMLFYEAYWKKSLEPGGGAGLYRDGIELSENGSVYRHEPYANPPFVIHLMRAAGGLSGWSGMPFAFWMRAPSILADLGIVLVLLAWLRPVRGKEAAAVAMVALSPVSLLLSGFHGSTDSVLTCFLLLSLWLAERKHQPAWAAAAFGLSLSIKVMPVLFLPAVLAWLPDWKERARFFGITSAVWLILAMPFLAQDPQLVLSRVAGYQSVYGNWGLSRFFTWLSAASGFGLPDELFRLTGKYLVVAAIMGGGVWLAHRQPRWPLHLRVALLAAAFFVISPGFGMQYLAWIAPWGVFAGPELLALFQYAGFLFLYRVYNEWSDGAWYLANSLRKPFPSGSIVFYEMLTYFTLAALALALWRRLEQIPGAAPEAAADAMRPVPAQTATGKRRRR